MILGFKQQFKDKILNGSKIHTIRLDEKNRWKVGMKIHFTTGVRTKKMDIFKLGECSKIDEIKINSKHKIITINGRVLSNNEINQLAINDGFDSVNDFWNWFKDSFKGRLIYF